MILCFRWENVITDNFFLYKQGCLGFIPCLQNDLLFSKTLQNEIKSYHDIGITQADGQRFIRFGNRFLHKHME